jgi:hypothetical protein
LPLVIVLFRGSYSENTTSVQSLRLRLHLVRFDLCDCGGDRKLSVFCRGPVYRGLAAIPDCCLDHDVADRSVRYTRDSKSDVYLDAGRLIGVQAAFQVRSGGPLIAQC